MKKTNTNSEPKNHAFIDGQNLYLAIKDLKNKIAYIKKGPHKDEP